MFKILQTSSLVVLAAALAVSAAAAAPARHRTPPPPLPPPAAPAPPPVINPPPPAEPAPDSQQVQTSAQANRDGFQGAAKAPLRDLNLIRTKIPPILLRALADPYERPHKLACPELEARIKPLDDVLGADLDTPSQPDDGHLIEKGKEAAGDLAVDAVRSTAEGLIPMRGWVRRLTGAERHDRLVAAAITAGGIRRGYLKGLGEAKGCAKPAPIHLAGPAPVIEDHRPGPKYPVKQ
ncbi:MAG: hypothetical protein JWP35_2087 [Caulobacter sp.]|nr:hypothetical protein [Caulobacter sp.]